MKNKSRSYTMKNIIRILFIVPTVLLFFYSSHVASVTDHHAVAELIPTNAANGDSSGESISLFSDTLVIGAVESELNGVDISAVYVYTRSGNLWQQHVLISVQN